MQEIEIHIGEIFLDRIPPGDPDLFRAALETGLSKRVTEQGWPAALSTTGHHDSLQAGSRIRHMAGSDFADELAGLIYNGLGSTTE